MYMVHSNPLHTTYLLIAKRLSTRLLIVQCSQFALYVCMYIYIRHTLIAWERFLWSRPQTTSHVVMVWPGGNWRVKKIMWELKWSRSSPSVIVLESENGNKGTMTPPQHVSLHLETHTTLRSLSETLQTTASPSSPLYLVPSTYN